MGWWKRMLYEWGITVLYSIEISIDKDTFLNNMYAKSYRFAHIAVPDDGVSYDDFSDLFIADLDPEDRFLNNEGKFFVEIYEKSFEVKAVTTCGIFHSAGDFTCAKGLCVQNGKILEVLIDINGFNLDIGIRYLALLCFMSGLFVKFATEMHLPFMALVAFILLLGLFVVLFFVKRVHKNALKFEKHLHIAITKWSE